MARKAASEKSWERQPNESVQAYEAFKTYLDMGSERSVRKVEQELHKSHALIARWSSTWNWTRRVREYDNELVRSEIAEKKKEVQKMRKRQLETGALLQRMALEALSKADLDGAKPEILLRLITEGARLEKENRLESLAASIEEPNAKEQTTTLADTIVNAYKRRIEEDGEDN